jgi:hypothetical protein
LSGILTAREALRACTRGVQGNADGTVSGDERRDVDRHHGIGGLAAKEPELDWVRLV